MNEATLSNDTLTITFKNTLKAVLTVRAWLKAWPVEETADDSDVRNCFSWFAPHIAKVEGTAWKPPAPNADAESIEASYQAFIALPQVTIEFVRACDKEVSKLHAPLSDVLQRPDETLTIQDIETAPNS